MTGSGPPRADVYPGTRGCPPPSGRETLCRERYREESCRTLPCPLASSVSFIARVTARGITRWTATTAVRPTSRAAKTGPSTLGGISEFSALRHERHVHPRDPLLPALFVGAARRDRPSSAAQRPCIRRSPSRGVSVPGGLACRPLGRSPL